MAYTDPHFANVHAIAHTTLSDVIVRTFGHMYRYNSVGSAYAFLTEFLTNTQELKVENDQHDGFIDLLDAIINSARDDAKVMDAIVSIVGRFSR